MNNDPVGMHVMRRGQASRYKVAHHPGGHNGSSLVVPSDSWLAAIDGPTLYATSSTYLHATRLCALSWAQLVDVWRLLLLLLWLT